MPNNITEIVIKIASIASLSIYLVFAGVLIRQIHLMVKTVKVEHEKLLRRVGWFHLLVVIVLLIISILV